MEIRVNKSLLYTILVFLGIGVGIASSFLLGVYGQNILAFITNNEGLGDVKESVPVFPNRLRIAYGNTANWSFHVFQARIVEYNSKGGLNYLTVAYLLGGKQYTVDVVVSRDESLDMEEMPWDLDIEASTLVEALEVYTHVRGGYDPEKIESYGESIYKFDELQKQIPVGSYIGVFLPAHYPVAVMRDSDSCEDYRQLCLFAVIWDSMREDIKRMYNKESLGSVKVLFPQNISDDIYLD